MNEELKNKLINFENENQCTVLYITKYGSKLYGTNNEFSDTDYKGVFVPSMNDILLKKDLDHWTSNSNNTNEKNGAEDIDLQLFSVHKLFQLLRKGETGALDLLFSMFSESVVFENEEFTELLKDNYTEFLNRNLHSFTGYAVGQAKKYGIKGTRYKELNEFNKNFFVGVGEHDRKLEEKFDSFRVYVKQKGLKYLRFVDAPGPKTGKGENLVEYFEVLGKKYSGDITQGSFFDFVKDMESQFGNRTKASSEGVDWKALSHSVRVILEVEELLDSGFITFPLNQKGFVKNVKEGKIDVDDVMEFINGKLDEVKEKMDSTTLPEKSNVELMDKLELEFIGW